MEDPFSAIRTGINCLENQLSALPLAHFSGQEEGDPDDFELTAGLSSAAAARFKGVTMRESHTKLESRTQREKRERLLDSLDKTPESHNKILFRHGTNISELQGSTQGTQGQVDALEGRPTRVDDGLGRVKEEIAMNISAKESAPFTAVDEISWDRNRRSTIEFLEPRRRRHPHGRYKSKGSSGNGGYGSGSDSSSDESKRKYSYSTDSEESEKHRRKNKSVTRHYLDLEETFSCLTRQDDGAYGGNAWTCNRDWNTLLWIR